MRKILLVDDDDDFRTSLAQRLKLRGFDTTDVGDPEEAIRIARNDLEIEVMERATTFYTLRRIELAPR